MLLRIPLCFLLRSCERCPSSEWGSFSGHFERPRVIRIRRSRLAVRHSKRERRCDSPSRMGRAIAAVCRGDIEKHCKTKEIRAAGRIWTVVMKLEPDRFVRTFLSGSDKSVRVGSAAGSFCVHGKSPALLSKRDSYKPSVSIQRWVGRLKVARTVVTQRWRS